MRTSWCWHDNNTYPAKFGLGIQSTTREHQVYTTAPDLIAPDLIQFEDDS